MTAPVSFAFPKSRRPVSSARPEAPALPLPAPGGIAFLGYGNWETYLQLDELLGSRGVRVRYHEGLIEIMSISPLHEKLKTRLGRFLEAWCDHTGKRYEMLGSATQRRNGRQAAEPDESYSFSTRETDKPDLVIEVALSSGGMNKLELWAGLGVPEIWIWQNQAMSIFRLKSGKYVRAKASRFLPGFPFHLLSDVLKIKNGSEAVREFRRRLASGM